MRKIVIYPGRFHPFHKGHAGTYETLVKQYGANNVFVVSSGKQAPVTSPFSFEQKTVMMQELGVPAQQIVQVKSPYNAVEVTSQFDANNTAVIYALSQKDVDRISFKPKKDGSPSYLQPLTNKLAPMSEHGYVFVAPTINFTILGKSIKSASEIRKMYIEGDDETRMKVITDLYGNPNERIKEIFDKELSLAESISRLEESLFRMPLTESRDDIANRYLDIMKQIKILEQEAAEDEINGIR